MNWINNYVNHIVSDRSGTWNDYVQKNCIFLFRKYRTENSAREYANQRSVSLSSLSSFLVLFLIWGSLRSGFRINLADYLADL